MVAWGKFRGPTRPLIQHDLQAYCSGSSAQIPIPSTGMVLTEMAAKSQQRKEAATLGGRGAAIPQYPNLLSCLVVKTISTAL